jgi:hypothetical protein
MYPEANAMKRNSPSLASQVVMWPTPQANEIENPNKVYRSPTNAYRGNKKVQPMLADVCKHGPAAPANPSTDGSRPELWRTPCERDHHPNGLNRTRNVPQILLSHQVTKQWATPRAGKTTDENPETWAARQAKGDVATMPLTAQVKMWRTPSVAEEKNQNTSTQIYLQNQVGATPKAWATPQASDHIEGARTELTSNQKCLGRDMKQWATPIMGDSHLASTPEVAQKRIEEGKVTLSRQTAAWATPQLQDGHNINQDSTTHKTIPAQLTKMNMSGKLNPRWVETLMGLPVGWVMPSCASPVTTEPTNSGSWEMGFVPQQQQKHL